MRALLTKEYIDIYDMRKISRAVLKLFDDYNYKKAIVQVYENFNSSNSLSYEHRNTKNIKSDPTYKKFAKRDRLLGYLNCFEEQMNNLKSTFTDDELKVFHFTIEERMSDKITRDKINKADKTYYLIKKSCYVKIALKFGLIDVEEDTILTTIDLIH